MTEPTERDVSPNQVDKSPDKIRGMFDRIAPRYDFLNHLLSLGIDHYWRWRLARRVRPSATSRMLDVCTGTGDLALALWRASGRQTEVQGVDFSANMIEIGKQKVIRRKAGEQVSLAVGDAENIAFDDDRFDIVTVAFGLRNVCSTHRGLEEMTRVCRPGGQVAILEFTTPRIWLIGPLYDWYFSRVLPRIGRFFVRSSEDDKSDDGGAYTYLPESVGQFPQREQLVALMQQAGLVDVTYHGLTFGIATMYVGRKKVDV